MVLIREHALLAFDASWQEGEVWPLMGVPISHVEMPMSHVSVAYLSRELLDN